MTEIKCPFGCGRQGPEIVREPLKGDLSEVVFYAKCGRCQAQGPKCGSANTALAGWNQVARLQEKLEALQNEQDYDPGLINDYGGGNVDWWQDYIRYEVNRCNEYWRSLIE